MRAIPTQLLLALFVLGVHPQLLRAQQFAQGFGEIYLTMDIYAEPWDVTSGANCIENPGLAPFTPLEFFLAIDLNFADIGRPELNATHGFDAWEARVHIPEELTIIERTLQPPAIFPLPTEDNWIVFLSDPVVAADTPFAVVEYTGILLQSARNVWINFEPSDPSSFAVPGGPGHVPGWRESVPTGDCIDDGEPVACLRPFGRWSPCEYEALVINYSGPGGCVCHCTCDPVQQSTWGAVKSRF